MMSDGMIIWKLFSISQDGTEEIIKAKILQLPLRKREQKIRKIKDFILEIKESVANKVFTKISSLPLIISFISKQPDFANYSLVNLKYILFAS